MMRRLRDGHEPGVVVVSIFLLALVVRLLFVWLTPDYVPRSDGEDYHRLAQGILEGKWFLRTDGTPAASRPPLYPMLLAAIYAIFGTSWQAVRYLQSVIDAFTAVIVLLIGKKVFGSFVGILSGIIYALYFTAISACGLLLTENLFLFLSLLAVLLILMVRQDFSLAKCAILGMVFGLANVTRPILLFLPLIVAAFLLLLAPKDRLGLKKSLVRGGIIVMVYALVYSPWIVRNYLAFGMFVPSTGGGIILYSVYNPEGGIQIANVALDETARFARSMENEAEGDRYLYRKALETVKQNPKVILKSSIIKLLSYFGPYDWSVTYPQGKGVYNFTYVFLLPFALFALYEGRRRWRDTWPLLLPQLYTVLFVLVLLFGEPRFRLPNDPLLFLFGAHGLVLTFERLTVRDSMASAWGHWRTPFPLVVLSYLILNFAIFLFWGAELKHYARNVVMALRIWP